jgi:hypothetical protein
VKLAYDADNAVGDGRLSVQELSKKEDMNDRKQRAKSTSSLVDTKIIGLSSQIEL